MIIYFISVNLKFFLRSKRKKKKIEKQKEILNNTRKNINNYLSFLESKNEEDIDEQINYLYKVKNKKLPYE